MMMIAVAIRQTSLPDLHAHSRLETQTLEIGVMVWRYGGGWWLV